MFSRFVGWLTLACACVRLTAAPAGFAAAAADWRQQLGATVLPYWFDTAVDWARGGYVLADSARATAWYKETRQSFMQKGYPPYRTTTMSMPGSSDPNPVSRDFLAAVKRAVDPQNLIAPGRYGMPERDGKDL